MDLHSDEIEIRICKQVRLCEWKLLGYLHHSALATTSAELYQTFQIANLNQ